MSETDPQKDFPSLPELTRREARHLELEITGLEQGISPREVVERRVSEFGGHVVSPDPSRPLNGYERLANRVLSWLTRPNRGSHE